MTYPLFLNLAGRLGVVVGGGAVGRRKAEALLAGGARVRLVCLEPPPAELASRNLEWRTEPYRAEHLDGACLVFAAGTPEVNRQVAADARTRGLWLNVADLPLEGDFLVPAVLRRGELTIAVGTDGASPRLAQEVRDHLETHFDDAFSWWVSLLAELRPIVLERISDPGRRRACFEELCRWEWLERLRREGPAAVRAALLAGLNTLADGASAGL